jgi:hypothetical protein
MMVNFNDFQPDNDVIDARLIDGSSSSSSTSSAASSSTTTTKITSNFDEETIHLPLSETNVGEVFLSMI